MPEGVIVGGWSYVTAAYAITFVVMGLYAWSLYRRGCSQDGDTGSENDD